MKSKDEAILAILYDELSYVHLLEGKFELSLKYSDLVLALDRPGQEAILYLFLIFTRSPFLDSF